MLVDSHCHLDFPDFAEDRAGIIARAADAGVGAMVTISTRVRRFQQILDIVEAHENVFGSVGTHPQQAAEEPDITADDLIQLSAHPKIVAIGEAGLDYHYETSSADLQKRSFLQHIAAARETGLPLVIHARSADDDMIRILENETAKGAFPAVLHCFSSGPELAKRGIELGLYISFSGILTFRNSQEIRDIAAFVPEDRLLVETDAPFLAPVPHRGKTNEPAFVAHTATVLANLKGWTPEHTGKQTTENFARLFKKVPAKSLGLHEAIR
ncbi:TatD family hydrolase [Terrihabitans sp. B22-R8]|uniref:TatD family hydrolase n=1 Tax=Terrihabitans sp. B22-R8 TaxID=3425128 RepID=UPI00403C909C